MTSPQLDDADAWDYHLVRSTLPNTARLRTHPKLKLLSYKARLSEARATWTRRLQRNWLNPANDH